MRIPTGRVTFVFTDIEGSTKLLHEIGDDRFRGVLDEHNRLIRDAVGPHRAYEVKTEGDAFFFSFTDPIDAVHACVDAQRALLGHDWADAAVDVRMGMHVGAAHVVDDDYVGLAVHEAARIGGAANGRQVLVSEAVARDVEGRLRTGVELHDTGRHLLKDFPTPQPLFQVVHPDLPRDVPPPRTLSARDHNLPVALTPLAGRVEDLAELVGAVTGGRRLVTITGMGGLGKSRLAIEAGWQLLSWFRDGVWFAPLASLTDPAAIPDAIRETIGVPERPGQDPVDRLASAIGDATMLLVLDNLEQLVGGVDVLSELLARCPSVSVLATSRERLRLRGELDFRIDPLAVPAADASAAEIRAAAAGALLEDRLRSTIRRFDLAAHAGSVVRICRRLDGIPLALELAAGAAADLGVEVVAERLDGALGLLTDGERDLPERQQTLRAAIAWSEDLLDPRERDVFMALAAFRGGFSTAAVGAVAELADADTGRILERLVDKSLVNRTGLPDADGVARYWMLEPLRQYAVDRLAADPERDRTLRHRHVVTFRDKVRALAPDLVGPRQRRALELIDVDRENIAAAAEHADADDQAALIAAAARYYSYRGHWREGRALVDAALDAGGGSPAERAMLRLAAGGLATSMGDGDRARRHLEACLELAVDGVAPDTEALACNVLGRVCSESGDDARAAALWDRGLRAAQTIGDDRTSALIEKNRGNHAWERRDLETAERAWRSALASLERIGDQAGATQLWTAMGNLAFAADDFDGARNAHDEAMRRAESIGNVETYVRSGIGLVRALLALGEPSLDRAREVVEGAEALGRPDLVAIARHTLAEAVASESEDVAAVEAEFAAAHRAAEAAGDQGRVARIAEILAELRAVSRE